MGECFVLCALLEGGGFQEEHPTLNIELSTLNKEEETNESLQMNCSKLGVGS
jgi:hypothetical protein